MAPADYYFYHPITSRSHSSNLVPRVFSLFNMAAAREKTLPGTQQNHVTKISNEDGNVFKIAAKAK